MAALGTAGNPLAVVVGGAIGFIIGRYVCGLDSVSAWFKDKFDFSVQISALISNPESHRAIANGLVAASIVANETEASVLLRYVVREVNRDPGKYFKIAGEHRKTRGPAAGKDKHGLFILGSQAGGATRAAEGA